MSQRSLNQGFITNRTLNGLNDLTDADEDLDAIKEKYDFDGVVESGTLLIGNSAGNYIANRLTAGANITITNSTAPNTSGIISIASSQVVINAGTNLSKTTSINGDITINLDAIIGGMTSVNGFTLVSNTSSSANQFLLKDASVGGFPNNGFLTINGNGLVQGTTQDVIKAFIHSSILGGTNITKNTAGGNATLNLNAILTGLTSIDGTSDLPLKRAGVEKIKLEATKVEFKENSSTLGANLLLKKGSGNQDNNADYEIRQDYTTGTFSSNRYEAGVRFQRYLSSSNFTQFFCGYHQSEGQSIWLNPNNDLHYIFRSGVLKIRKPDDTSHNFSIQLGNNASTFVMTNLSSATFDCDTFRCCKSRFHGISSGNNLFLFNGTQQTVVGNNLNFLEQYGDGSLLKLRGTTIKLFSTTNEIISLDNTAVSYNRKIGMNSNPINFGSATDANHQILYSGSGMNGVMIRGFGLNGVPFFRLQSSDGSVNVLDAYTNKVVINKLLGMEAQPINLNSSTDNNHQILWSGSGMNGVLVRGFGNNVPFFRLQGTANGTHNVLDAYINKVVITKPLEFNAGISDTASIAYNNAKQLSINIVAGGEVRIDNGGVNYFKTIAQGGGANGRTFFFEQGGDSGQSNGGAFQAQCSRGKVLFQGDRNLVIYNPDGGVAFSANDSKNAHSSRDYKTNINDLVEDESVNIIKQINPVSFEYKKEYYDELDECSNCNCNVRKGFIWEDIKPILPQSAKSVNMNNPDYPMTKVLDLREIIPDLVKTIQYLMNKVDNLQSQIDNLN